MAGTLPLVSGGWQEEEGITDGALRCDGHLDIYCVKHHDAYVRTTLTLDDDLVAKLKELAHRQGTTFKGAVNAAIRRGLTGPSPSTRQAKPFRVKTFRSPFRPGVDPLRLNQLVDELEARRFGGGT